MRVPILLFLVGMAVFSAFAGSRLKIHTADNHFVYLADTFLEGEVELVRRPHHQNDWATYEVLKLKGKSLKAYGDEVSGFFTRKKTNEFRTLTGELLTIPRRDRGASRTRHFVSFPPMPAVLMMPFVAMVGYGTNDVLFTVFFAALNTMLLFILLRRLRTIGYSKRTTRENIWLTVLFAFGTSHLWCAVLGQVWFTALIVGATFHLGYIYFAIDARKPVLAGICLAAAFSTRATMVFAAVFFYLQLFFPTGERLSGREIVKRFVLFSTPCLIVGLTLLWYNYARFQNPFEFGHTYLAGGTMPRIRDFGLFHPDFVSRNLKAAFWLTPKLLDKAPYIQISKHGMSLLLTTPALIFLLRPSRSHPLARSMAISALVIAVPIFFYQNTGWEQFGFRFSIDFLPYLIGCFALGARPLTRWVKGLVIVGVLVNSFGAVTFKRASGPLKGLYGDFGAPEPKLKKSKSQS